MCLNRIDPEKKNAFRRDANGDIICWGLFALIDGRPYPWFRKRIHTTGFVPGEWYTARPAQVTWVRGTYPAGFHRISDRKKAKKIMNAVVGTNDDTTPLVLLECRVRGARVFGVQHMRGIDATIVVGDEMKIVEGEP